MTKRRKDFLQDLDNELQSVDPKSLRSPTAKDGEVQLDFRFANDRQKLLKSRGVDGYPFSLARSPFVLEDALVRIKPVVLDVQALAKKTANEQRDAIALLQSKHAITWLPEEFVMRSVSVKKQIANVQKVLENPLRGSYTMAIGSYPSDTRAKLLALNFMNKAIDAQQSGQHRARAYPLWHTLYGSNWDSLRDSREEEHFSMLIITNVGMDSSTTKLEKLRDLLVKYGNVPKIVVVNGCDPVTFFAEKVRLPLNYAFYLSAEQKASIMDI